MIKTNDKKDNQNNKYRCNRESFFLVLETNFLEGHNAKKLKKTNYELQNSIKDFLKSYQLSVSLALYTCP